MTEYKMELEDWLDDLCVRFIINCPREDLSSVPRICFQVEEAQWFYEDFIRPLDPSLPSMSLRSFCLRIFQHCPLLSVFSHDNHMRAFEEFLTYKNRVPVRGAIMLNHAMDSVVLVKGWKASANWSFPRGKISKDEDDLDCAIREVYEETGFDIRAAGLVPDPDNVKYIDVPMREQHYRLYCFRDVPMDTPFAPRTRKEISKIQWYKLSDLPAYKKRNIADANVREVVKNANKFYMVAPFLGALKKWIQQQRQFDATRLASSDSLPQYTDEPQTEEEGFKSTVEDTGRRPSMRADPESSLNTMEGATLALKELLKIQPPTQGLQENIPEPNPETAQDTGNSLLALLRGGPGSTARTPQAHNHGQSQSQGAPRVSRQIPRVSHQTPVQVQQPSPQHVSQHVLLQQPQTKPLPGQFRPVAILQRSAAAGQRSGNATPTAQTSDAEDARRPDVHDFKKTQPTRQGPAKPFAPQILKRPTSRGEADSSASKAIKPLPVAPVVSRPSASPAPLKPATFNQVQLGLLPAPINVQSRKPSEPSPEQKASLLALFRSPSTKAALPVQGGALPSPQIVAEPRRQSHAATPEQKAGLLALFKDSETKPITPTQSTMLPVQGVNARRLSNQASPEQRADLLALFKNPEPPLAKSSQATMLPAPTAYAETRRPSYQHIPEQKLDLLTRLRGPATRPPSAAESGSRPSPTPAIGASTGVLNGNRFSRQEPKMSAPDQKATLLALLQTGPVRPPSGAAAQGSMRIGGGTRENSAATLQFPIRQPNNAVQGQGFSHRQPEMNSGMGYGPSYNNNGSVFSNPMGNSSHVSLGQGYGHGQINMNAGMEFDPRYGQNASPFSMPQPGNSGHNAQGQFQNTEGYNLDYMKMLGR